MPSSRAEKQKQRRALFAKAGRCTTCGMMAVAGRKKCQDCLDYAKGYAKNRYQSLKVSKKCVVCSAKLDPDTKGVRCAKCVEASKIEYKKLVKHQKWTMKLAKLHQISLPGLEVRSDEIL